MAGDKMTMTKNNFWQFKQKADKKSAELLLYGQVASERPWWDESGEENSIIAIEFARQLRELGDIETLDIYLNSPGGDVFAGQAISAMLQRHKAFKTCYIDGLAASIAVNIILACDKRVIPKNAMIMVHNPAQGLLGYYNASQLRKIASDLDRIGESSVALYIDSTGLSAEKVKEVMDGETWLTAEEAVEQGWATEIESSKQIAACVAGNTVEMGNMKFDMSIYKNFPVDKLQLIKTKPIERVDEKVDLEKIKQEYPELYNTIKEEGKTEGIKQERERIQEIDKLAAPGIDEFKVKAKYETFESADKVALQLVQSGNLQKAVYLQQAAKDAEPLGGVEPGGAPNPQTEDDKKMSVWKKCFAKGAERK